MIVLQKERYMSITFIIWIFQTHHNLQVTNLNIKIIEILQNASRLFILLYRLLQDTYSEIGKRHGHKTSLLQTKLNVSV